MNKEVLDQLIGTTPPSTVDVDRIIVRQRRRRRFRHLAAGGGTGTAVVLAVVLGMSLVGGRLPQEVPVATTPLAPAGSGGTSEPGAVATEGGGQPGTDGTDAMKQVTVETATEAGRRRTLIWLQGALEGAVEKHAPGTRWIYMPDVPGERRTPDGHPTMWIDTEPTAFNARSGVTADGEKGGFYLTLRPADCSEGFSCSPLHECDRSGPDCTSTRTASGLELVRWVERPGKSWVFYGVDVRLADGVHALRLLAVNYFGGDGQPAGAPRPILTRTELDRVVTDIADRITR